MGFARFVVFRFAALWSPKCGSKAWGHGSGLKPKGAIDVLKIATIAWVALAVNDTVWEDTEGQCYSIDFKNNKMSDTTPTPEINREEIETAIAELEQYRQRIIDETLAMAQKIKVAKKTALQQLEAHPEIAQIDGMLTAWRDRLAQSNL